METRKCAACGKILSDIEPGYYNPNIGLLCKLCYSKNLTGYKKSLKPKR